jgi:hypothetical protein
LEVKSYHPLWVAASLDPRAKSKVDLIGKKEYNCCTKPA